MSTIAVSPVAQQAMGQRRSQAGDAARHRPARPGTVRLTHRGRAVVTGLALVLGAAVVFSAQSAAADGPSAATPVVTHTVSAGQTLWHVAEGIAAPGQDVREVVDELVALNGLADGSLQVGQQLLVPVP